MTIVRWIIIKLLLVRAASAPKEVAWDDANNDYAFVFVDDSIKGKRCYVENISRSQATLSRRRGEEIEKFDISVRDLMNREPYVLHYFGTVRYKYETPLAAVRGVFLGGAAARTREQRRFDMGLRNYIDRMEVLETLVALTLSKDSPFSGIDSTTITEEIYGEQIRASEHFYDRLTHVRFLLESFEPEEVEVLESNASSVKLGSKGIATLSKHELEMQKHQDLLNVQKKAIKVARLQVAVAFVMAILTLVLIWIRLFDTSQPVDDQDHNTINPTQRKLAAS